METGLEVYEQGNIDIEASIKRIGDAMIARNKEKYGDFLKTFESVDTLLKVNFVPHRKLRSRLFQLTYFVCRLVDDIVDGDTNIQEVTHRKLFVDEAFFALQGSYHPSLIGSMIQESLQIAQILGVTQKYKGAMTYILESMNFDLERIQDPQKLRTSKQLNENFHRLDIEGTIVGTALIFGLDTNETVHLLTPLGKACRIAYTLEDLVGDYQQGLYNIPSDIMAQYDITDEDIEKLKKGDITPGVQKWMHSQIDEIYALLEEHKQRMKKNISLDFSEVKVLNVVANMFVKKWYNFLLRLQVYPKAYIGDITRILDLPFLKKL